MKKHIKKPHYYQVWRNAEVIIRGEMKVANAHSCEMNVRVMNQLRNSDIVQVSDKPIIKHED